MGETREGRPLEAGHQQGQGHGRGAARGPVLLGDVTEGHAQPRGRRGSLGRKQGERRERGRRCPSSRPRRRSPGGFLGRGGGPGSRHLCTPSPPAPLWPLAEAGSPRTAGKAARPSVQPPWRIPPSPLAFPGSGTPRSQGCISLTARTLRQRSSVAGPGVTPSVTHCPRLSDVV